MKVKRKKVEGGICFEIEDYDLTLLELLTHELLKTKGIRFAGYRIIHPLLKKAEFVVKAKDVDGALKEAFRRIEEKLKSLGNALQKI